MAAPSSSSKDGVMSEVISQLLKEEQTFTWIIKDFDLVRQSDDLIEGQKFQFEAGHSIGVPTYWKFYLMHCERGDQEQKTKWISFYSLILKKPEDVEQVIFSHEFECVNRDGNTCVKQSGAFLKVTDYKIAWGKTEFIKREAALNDLPLVDGSLIIRYKFIQYAVQTQVSVQDIPFQLKTFEEKAIEQLIKDLGQVHSLTDGDASPLAKIISKDKVEFPVNRAILSARNPVFQQMFKSGMKEATTGVVQIDDLSAKTVSVLLHYLTTGTLHQDWKSDEVILELPYAAQKYGLELVVEFLDKVLGSICTIGNVKELSVLANKLGMKKAEGDLLAFIKDKAAAAKSMQELTTLMDATNA